MAELPTGTVTFLFSDIEGSTRLLNELGDEYRALLEAHAGIMRDGVASCEGIEVSTEGDSFFVVFRSAPRAVRAAVECQRAFAAGSWPGGRELRVRMGLHTGEGKLGGDDYLGIDVHRAARIAGAGHGGQVLLSAATKALVEHDLPEGVALRELGEHRLKDLTQPEHLYQLVVDGLVSEFPPLKSLDATPNNLPVQLTSFVGRQQEVREVAGMLETGRLVTLTGPGGTGKTRLSLQVAAEVSDRFPDGVFFVPLATVTDPGLVASTMAAALGLHQVSGDPVQRLSEYLEHRRLLLVLDNFEQVLEAGALVGELLRAASDLHAVVTSRAALRISGEQEYPVPPMGIPDLERMPPPEELLRSEAVGLFVERARAAKPSFALTAENAPAVAEITARLDGLPLAIELAAARVKLLPAGAILDRLGSRLSLLSGGPRDLPARQQTLHDAIAWSYDLLDRPGQRLLCRLSVFVGGAMLEEAEAVCGPSEELGADVLDGLGMLVDQSLLRQQEILDQPRFAMLETIREFALEVLGESGEAETLRRRHLEAFLQRAREAQPHIPGPDQVRWLDRLEVEHDNLRTALAFAQEQEDAECALSLVAAVWRFWQMRGHLDEARGKIESVLEMQGGDPIARVEALEAAGGVAYWQGDMARAEALYEACVSAYRELGDRPKLAGALYNLAFPKGFADQRPEAEALLGEALELYRELGDEAGVGLALWGLGSVAVAAGDFETARDLLSESLELIGRGDDPFSLGWAHRMLGMALLGLGDPVAAREHLEPGLKIFADARDLSGIVLHLRDFAVAALAEGDHRHALRLSGAMASLRKVSGTDLVEVAFNEIAGLDEAAGTVGDEEARRLLDQGGAMSVEEAVRAALGVRQPSA